MASAARLNVVRYHGYDRLTLTVHCVHTPASAMITACSVPRRRSAVRSAAYETDNVELLASGIGRLSFHNDVRHDVISSAMNSHGSCIEVGNQRTTAAAPAAITDST